MADGKPGRGSDQFPLRLPDGMRERIKSAAEESGRSMNAEIVARLSESFISGERDRQTFMHHMASVDAFINSAPPRRDVIVMTLLEQVELIRTLSDNLRDIIAKDAQT